MGEPVKIVDLARNLIVCQAFTPDVDIKIEFTGLRPGESFAKNCSWSRKACEKTANQRIFIGNPLPVDGVKLKASLTD